MRCHRNWKHLLFKAFCFTYLWILLINFIERNDNNKNRNYIRKDSIRLHELDIQSRISSEKGTGCNMPKTNPFAAEIMKFVKDTPKITCPGIDWVECLGNLCYVIKDVLETSPNVECYYSDIIFINDDEYRIEKSVRVVGDEKYVLDKSDHVKVECTSNAKIPFRWWSLKWSGVKAGFRNIEDTEDTGQDRINVLIVGIDSISHNHFLRKLPMSFNYLTQQLNAVVLNNYNILGDGTPAALFPILTGKTELEMPDVRRINKGKYFNPKDFLFGLLKAYKYRTAHFEDLPQVGIFQLRFNGFSHQPSDHYLRPLFMAGDKDLYCEGSTPRFALMLNLTKQFIQGKGKRFCLTFTGDVSHDDSNLVSNMEDELTEFLRFLKENDILNHTLLFVMGDHGPRYSKLRATYQGKIEERLPFVSIVLPDLLKKRKKYAEQALRLNADVLTTPFDIHTTILDAVDLIHHRNFYTVPGSALPRGMSLLAPIPSTRSCAEADIEAHWCACLNWVNVSQDDPVYERVANEFLSFVNGLVANKPECAKRELLSIEWVFRQAHNDQVLKPGSGEGLFAKFRGSVVPSVEYFEVKVVTGPGRAVFESSVMYLKNENHFLISENDISRVNAYGNEPSCIVKTHPHLSKYCYCLS